MQVGGVSQVEYDRVVAERDIARERVWSLHEELGIERDKVDNLQIDEA